MGLKLHALGFVLDEADARSRLVMRMSVRFMTFDRAGAWLILSCFCAA